MTERAPSDPLTLRHNDPMQRFAEEVDRWLDRHAGVSHAQPPLTPSGATLDRLMSLLDPPIADRTEPEDARRQLLINVTHARIRRAIARTDAREETVAASLRPTPCTPPSAKALDRFVEHGWEPRSLGSDAQRLSGLLAMLDVPPPGEAERSERIERTVMAIRASAANHRRRMKIDPESIRGMVVPQRAFRLSDIASIAAMLLIGIGVLWPMLVSSREQARTAACAAGMHQAGVGFGLFARDHDGRMPAADLVEQRPAQPPSRLAMSPPSQQPWWHVGTPGSSHSANLFVVVRLGYTHLGDTACPGNEHAPTNLPPEALAEMHDWATNEQVSYSYQLFWGRPPRLGYRPDGIVMGDRSPVVEHSRRGEPVDMHRSSQNHRHLGQNVLRQDGAVAYITSPVLPNGDNIWLPRFLETTERPILRGTELPSIDGDTFLGP